MLSRFAIAVLIVCPGALPVDGSSGIHKQGKIEVLKPRQHLSGKGWDFCYQTDGKASYLHPQNGTRLVVGGLNAAGFSGCAAADFRNGGFAPTNCPLEPTSACTTKRAASQKSS